MIEAYPLTWPSNKLRTPSVDRQRAKFSKSETKYYGDVINGSRSSYRGKKPVSVYEAVSRLMAEIRRFTKTGQGWRIDPDDVIISTNMRVKLDGTPYSNQRDPLDSGVAVYFNLDDVQYCFPCDKWDRVADNITAIAAHLEAMRGMERWGVGESHDVFTGFKALPAAAQLDCWEILGIKQTKDVNLIKTQYRGRAFETHPDSGGSADKFQKLNEAYEMALKFATA